MREDGTWTYAEPVQLLVWRAMVALWLLRL
jgi:hypothetical protein